MSRIHRHIPEGPLVAGKLLSFEASLAARTDGSYDLSAWLYLPPFYAEYRYVLGSLGHKPLICLGLNPSTARPGSLDNTLKSVERVARHNGYDSFLMMNLYAQRATIPGHMDVSACDFLHQQNILAFAYLLERSTSVWAAWGAIVETRAYLSGCLRDFVHMGQQAGARWYTAGPRSKKGHPHHPLYLKKESLLDAFDVADYLSNLGQ